MRILLGLFFLGFVTVFLLKYLEFKHSNYKSASGNGFLKTLFDKGNYGEFLTFLKLERLKGYNKIMCNLYIPKKDGTTTEIDLLLLSETDIYVFESKNYSGWIFGDEKNRNWTQTLQNREKNRFYNPIWQNKGHINALSAFLENDHNHLYQSYIIFSERCTLKKINITSANVKVIKRNNLLKQMKNDKTKLNNLLKPDQIESIYKKLKNCCLVDDKIKKAHVEQIQVKNNR
ncbi:hypothetical protein J2T56_000643 [Natronobacillus azotifigens]|uniref:Nuclease-related domain-containing protein n=1 Tax=Natronobacillus azotifigens TaxID=472978 RepID=A0A9J6RAC9_9BACI|nr:nuclease-related domain-containing protein [Natronobacillus azotifigens]MCZ0702318.1 nuclease-related domain-containing protein [Natronobacillus azotifigens]